MKNIIRLLPLLLIPIISFAQENITLTSEAMNTRFYEESKIPVVKGQLINYSAISDKHLYFKYDIVVPSSKNKETKLVDIQVDGSFSLELDHPFPYQQIWLELGEDYYGEIIAHDSLFIKLDLGQLRYRPVRYIGEGVEFSGSDADLNIYKNQFNRFQNSKKGQFYKTKQASIFNNKLGIAEQVKAYQKTYEIWDEIVSDFHKQNSSEHIWVLKNERDADYYGGLFTLYWQKKMDETLLKEALQHQPLLLSNFGNAYYEYLSKLIKLLGPAENFELIKYFLEQNTEVENLAELDEFLNHYQKRMNRQPFDELIYLKGSRLFLEPNKSRMKNARLDAFASKLAAMEPALADVLRLFAAPRDRWKQQVYYEKFLPYTATPWVRDYMSKDFKQEKAYTSSIQKTLENAHSITTSNSLGMPVSTMPFDAKLYLGTGTEAKKLIAAIQNAFPGKGIILDVWATWCKPCLVDMQRSKAKKEALKELPVEMVYLCVADGGTSEAWESKIAQLEVSGNHIFLEKDLAQSLLEYFNISAYPSHIFIDQFGNWDDTFIQSMVSLNLYQLEKKL